MLKRIFYLLLLISQSLSEKDKLNLEKPDKFDMKMAKNDKYLAGIYNKPKPEETTPPSPSKEAQMKKDKLDKQVEALKKVLGEKNLVSLTDSDFWNKLYNYIKINIDKFLKNGHLGFSFPVRYNFCLFVIPIIPAQSALVFPAFYKFLIPPKVKKIEMVAKFLNEFDGHLRTIKKKSSTQLLVTVYLKRKGNFKEEIEMIRKIPDLIVQDPAQLLRWVFNFAIEVY